MRAVALVAFALVAYAHASTPTPHVTQRPRVGGGVVYTLTLDGVTATVATDGEGGVYAVTPKGEIYEMGEDEKSTLKVVFDYVIKELKQIKNKG
jgi:hypothetical protein